MTVPLITYEVVLEGSEGQSDMNISEEGETVMRR